MQLNQTIDIPIKLKVILLKEWKLQFHIWLKEKHQCTPNINDWYALKLLSHESRA